MNAEERGPHPRRRLGQVWLALAAFLLWNLIAGGALFLMEPVEGAIAAAALFLLFLYGFVLRTGRTGELRRWADLRLRPLRGSALRSTLVAAPVLLALVWSAQSIWLRLVRVPPETLNPFEELTGTPAGRLAIALLAIVSAPILEEMVFRGMIQRPLERRMGPAVGITAASLLFAILHVMPSVLPIHLMLGLAFGFAVWATRSIWSGVILHAANNAVAMMGLSAGDPVAVPTVWETGPTPELWTAIVMLVLSSMAAWWVGRWMLRTRDT